MGPVKASSLWEWNRPQGHKERRSQSQSQPLVIRELSLESLVNWSKHQIGWALEDKELKLIETWLWIYRSTGLSNQLLLCVFLYSLSVTIETTDWHCLSSCTQSHTQSLCMSDTHHHSTCWVEPTQPTQCLLRTSQYIVISKEVK